MSLPVAKSIHSLSSDRARCITVAGILLAHVGVLLWLSAVYSPTFDETAHLPAGLSHWTVGRFELYRVNPPLVRMAASLAVLPFCPKYDWTQYSLSPAERPEFPIGNDFITANGDNAFLLFMVARWACIPFSVLGGLLCYIWSRRLWGNSSGIISLALWCSDPNVLGNGCTIQPDVPAASMAVLAVLAFASWARSPPLSKIVLAGAAVGCALLTKTTLLLLIPLLPAIWLLASPRNADARWRFRRALHASLQMALITCVAMYVVNVCYGFRGSFQPLGTYTFVSDALRSNNSVDTQQGYASAPSNRFAGSLIANVPVPFPEDYVGGIDEQKREFEGRRTSYLRGESRWTGWWYYYIYAAVVKCPVCTQMLFLLSVLLLPRSGFGLRGCREVMVVVLPAVAFGVFVSVMTGMTQHLRYTAPVWPFLFILAGGAGRVFECHKWVAMRYLVGAFLTWSIIGSFATLPHSHSYFNELVGGSRYGHNHLLSSNVDYGEDLFFLRDWLRENAPGRGLTLAYFGNLDPRLVGIEFSSPPAAPEPGLHAVSVNFLHECNTAIPDGRGGFRAPYDYSYFLNFSPKGYAGFGIFIYDLTAADIEAAASRSR